MLAVRLKKNVNLINAKYLVKMNKKFVHNSFNDTIIIKKKFVNNLGKRNLSLIYFILNLVQ